jgi:hypothetical protein
LRQIHSVEIELDDLRPQLARSKRSRGYGGNSAVNNSNIPSIVCWPSTGNRATLVTQPGDWSIGGQVSSDHGMGAAWS